MVLAGSLLGLLPKALIDCPMPRKTLSAVLLLCSQVLVAQQPAKNSEAAKFGLLGAVRTVLTESLDYRDSTQGTPTGSTLAIYDATGYLLEDYRYYPDGAVHLHTTYTRKGL